MPDLYISNPGSKPPHTHLLAAFCDHPKGVWFETKESDENILLLLRRHFITNIPWIITALILLTLPFLFSFLVSTTGIQNPFADFIPASYIPVFLFFYYLVIFTYALINFMNWYYNTSLVTEKRIIDIDFSNLVYHDVAATKIDLVQDVDYKQVGALRSLFNYGDVFVQTASKSPNFDFLAVPKPLEVTRIIEELIGKNP